MPKIDYADIRAGVYVSMNGTVFEILENTFSKKSRQQGSNQVRMRNLSNQSVISKTFHASDKLESVEVEKQTVTFLYERNGEAMVHVENDPKNRFSIPKDKVFAIEYINEGTDITIKKSGEIVLSASPPIKVALAVTESPPAVKGNTAQGGSKRITLETGAIINAPLFINEGDLVLINTTTGEYVERAEKS